MNKKRIISLLMVTSGGGLLGGLMGTFLTGIGYSNAQIYLGIVGVILSIMLISGGLDIQ